MNAFVVHIYRWAHVWSHVELYTQHKQFHELLLLLRHILGMYLSWFYMSTIILLLVYSKWFICDQLSLMDIRTEFNYIEYYAYFTIERQRQASCVGFHCTCSFLYQFLESSETIKGAFPNLLLTLSNGIHFLHDPKYRKRKRLACTNLSQQQ